MSTEHLKLPSEKLTTICDPDELGFETTAEVSPLEGTIGQERAASALELALDIDAPGFNLFISGIPGTGRNTALKSHLDKIAITKPIPPDWGYVHNFQDPNQPIAIRLPCGMMRELAKDMDDLVDVCRREIPVVFESDDYTHRIEDVMKQIQEQRQAMTDELEQEAREVGFTLSFTQVGITPVPLIDDRPMTQEEFAQVSDDVREDLKQRGESIQHSITHVLQELRRLNKEATERSREVDIEVARFTLSPIMGELRDKYRPHSNSDNSDVVSYLDAVEADMIEHLEVFKPAPEPQSQGPSPLMPGVPSQEDVFVKYQVNDLFDNSTCLGAPVIFEYSPTYYNLFGRIDYKARVGTLTTDLTMVKPGALHRASGGYLVLQARDVMMSPLSWETIKRTLRSREVRIENIGEQYSPLPSATLRPQPIPVDAKIILVGGPDVLRALQMYDEDFRRYFKVTADFDYLMARTPENIGKYAAFVASQCKSNNLLDFDKTAVARILDYSSRLVEDQEKLTTRFMDIADMMTEANHWAKKDESSIVKGMHVKKAIEQRRFRLSMMDDRMREVIEQGTIHIDTDGMVVGQVNGLAVMSIGDFSFGKPSKITARASLGRGQLLNIERETRMSGKIHDKGFMILSGYLHGKYGQDRPLSLSASIGFEQTYSEIDGDSASSTELYALLSELSKCPIKQGIAVTGSVNQAGQVQAIGGAVYKIEGFFDICKSRGLTGEQGVMIPSDNVRNLLLKDDVVEAVSQGQFHIYAVSTVDEGIEVLTGVPAGERGEDGSYPEDTIHYYVIKHLAEMAEKAREFDRSHRDDDDDDKKKDDEEEESNGDQQSAE